MNSPNLPDALKAELFGPKPETALPETWVKALFARLEVRYGDAWSRKWASIPDMALVRDDWSRQLAGVTGEAIAHALKHLPDSPPNVQEFRALTRRFVPVSDVPQLGWKPGPLSPEVAKAVEEFKAKMRMKA